MSFWDAIDILKSADRVQTQRRLQDMAVAPHRHTYKEHKQAAVDHDNLADAAEAAGNTRKAKFHRVRATQHSTHVSGAEPGFENPHYNPSPRMSPNEHRSHVSHVNGVRGRDFRSGKAFPTRIPGTMQNYHDVRNNPYNHGAKTHIQAANALNNYKRTLPEGHPNTAWVDHHMDGHLASAGHKGLGPTLGQHKMANHPLSAGSPPEPLPDTIFGGAGKTKSSNSARS